LCLENFQHNARASTAQQHLVTRLQAWRGNLGHLTTLTLVTPEYPNSWTPRALLHYGEQHQWRQGPWAWGGPLKKPAPMQLILARPMAFSSLHAKTLASSVANVTVLWTSHTALEKTYPHKSMASTATNAAGGKRLLKLCNIYSESCHIPSDLRLVLHSLSSSLDGLSVAQVAAIFERRHRQVGWQRLQVRVQ